MSDGASRPGYVKCCTGKCKVFNVIQRYDEGTLVLGVGELMMSRFVIIVRDFEASLRSW